MGKCSFPLIIMKINNNKWKVYLLFYNNIFFNNN